MLIRGVTKWNTAVGPDGVCRGARMSFRGSTKWNTADQSDGVCRGARMSIRGGTKWNTAADQSDGACKGVHMSVRGGTKWDTADQLDGACRGACMSVREVTKWNTADRSDGACRGMCTCLSAEQQSEIRQTNLTGHAEGRARLTSVRGAKCREWCASSQFIIVESFLFYFCICYHLSRGKTNNWKTLSYTVIFFHMLCTTASRATKPKKVTAKLAKNFGGRTNHWKNCQGPCNLVSYHVSIYFGACIGEVKYHLSLCALCTKRNSPLLICSQVKIHQAM